MYKNLQKQADYIRSLSNKKQRPVEVGDTVMIPVPEFGRSKSDGRNILAGVMEKDDETMFCTLGTKSGMVELK